MQLSSFIKYSINFIIITISFFCLLYAFQFNVIVGHDNMLAFNRTFFEPEHGRYLATWLNNVLTQRIPEFLSIHPNDFRTVFVVPFKIIVFLMICILYAKLLFLFSDKSKKHSTEYIFTYIFIFLFFISIRQYQILYALDCFILRENMVFFEYTLPAVFYVTFWSLIIKALKDGKISPKNYILLLIFTFLLGSSIEIYNIPVFFALACFGIFYAVKYFIKKEKNKTFLHKAAGLYAVYLISLTIYYLHPADSSINIIGGWKNYITSYFSYFWNLFFGIYIKDMLFPFLTVIASLFIPICIYNDKKKTRKLFLFVSVNVFCIFLYLCLTFFLGPEFDDYYYFQTNKWIVSVFLQLMFHLIITASYLLYESIKISEKNSKITVVLLFFSILFIAKDSLVLNFPDKLTKERNNNRIIRETVYKAEKYALMQKNDILYLPSTLRKICTEYDTCYQEYFNNVHSNLHIKELKYSDEYNYGNIFSEDELKNIKFTNLYRYH